MSHPRISSPFNAAIIKAIKIESLDTNEEYIREDGVSVVCPPATNLALRRKFSPNLTSQTM